MERRSVAKQKSSGLWGMLIMIAVVLAVLFYLQHHNVHIQLPNIPAPH